MLPLDDYILPTSYYSTVQFYLIYLYQENLEKQYNIYQKNRLTHSHVQQM